LPREEERRCPSSSRAIADGSGTPLASLAPEPQLAVMIAASAALTSPSRLKSPWAHVALASPQLSAKIAASPASTWPS